jgi:hypothetical protein
MIPPENASAGGRRTQSARTATAAKPDVSKTADPVGPLSSKKNCRAPRHACAQRISPLSNFPSCPSDIPPFHRAINQITIEKSSQANCIGGYPMHTIPDGKDRPYKEGRVAHAIESRTAHLPSDLFMWAAFGAMFGSLLLKTKDDDHNALFVGQWVPTLLIFGLYNKMVKLLGSDEA